MRNFFVIIVIMIMAINYSFSQTNWQKGGNNVTGGAPITGTDATWNAPFRLYTTGTERMRINENTNYNMFYFQTGPFYPVWLTANFPAYTGFNPNGFVGINTTVPRSRLHIQGDQVCTSSPGTGWRPWMRTGVYMSEESNNMYVGMYKRTICYPNPGFQPTDAVVNWGDDPAGLPGIPNRLRINFTPTVGLFSGITPIYNSEMEMMSFWNTRRVGIGDFINFTGGPVSQLHMHNQFGPSNFLTITDTLTGFTNTDGLKIGVDNASGTTALFRQMENDHMIFSTNVVGLSGERMRITHTGAPGVFLGGTFSNNTRIGIPLSPTTPVTSPLSLIHLGFNMPVGTQAGWRPWMEQGIFNSRMTDHIYIGIKPETSSLTTDKNDAVIGWGDNNSSIVDPSGPDNLRFIFSSNQLIPGTTGNGESGFNGQEVARFTPNCITCPHNKASFGIGDFSQSGIQGPLVPADYVGATLDVDGDVIIRGVTQNNAIDKILVWDNSDHHGRLKWRDANSIIANVNANEGLYSNNNVVQLGVDCTNPSFGTVYPTTGLSVDRSVNLNNKKLTFDGGGTLGRIGIGMLPCAPVGNRLEITGFGADQSGLRFTNLNIFSPSFTPAPGLVKYLTVDANGDVVLADGVGGSTITANNGLSILPAGNVQFGNDLGNTTANLLNDREINMANNNIYFKDQGATGTGVINAIGIGYAIVTPGTSIRSKLSVLENSGVVPYVAGSTIYGANFGYYPGGANKENGTEAISGINKDANSTTLAKLQTGVYGESSGNNNGGQGMNAGGHFFATNGTSSNVGVYGVAAANTNPIGGFFVGDNNSPGSGTSIGTWGRGLNANTTSTGVKGEVINSSTTATNYGVYGKVGNVGVLNAGIYGIAPLTTNTYAGYFDGNVNIGSGGALSFTSDSILKTNVDSILDASQILNQLNPVTFNYTNVNVPQINVNGSNHFGLIAQQVENVLPDLVDNTIVPATYDSIGNIVYPAANVKTVNYTEIIPILIAGFNEQQEKIDRQDSTITAMQQQMNDMMAMISNCCGQGDGTLQTPNNNTNSTYQVVHNTDVKLSDTYCVLGENSPNPFKDHTVINYTLSESIQSAQILFYNTLGQVIKVLEIEDRGEGRLNVYAEDLRSGMYTYTLIIDGNVCESKKMIKE